MVDDGSWTKTHTNHMAHKGDRETSVVSQQAEPPQTGIPYTTTPQEDGY